MNESNQKHSSNVDGQILLRAFRNIEFRLEKAKNNF